MRSPNISTNHSVKEYSSGQGYPSPNLITSHVFLLPRSNSALRRNARLLVFNELAALSRMDPIPVEETQGCLLGYRLVAWNARRILEGGFKVVTMQTVYLLSIRYELVCLLLSPGLFSTYSHHVLIWRWFSFPNTRAMTVITCTRTVNAICLAIHELEDFRLNLHFPRRSIFPLASHF